MKTIKIFIILFTLAVLSISCSKDEDKKAIDKTFLIPLKINNYWIFRVYWYDQQQNLVKTDTTLIKVVSDTLIENQHYFKLDFFGIYYTNKIDGVYANLINTQSVIYKYPAKVGDKYIRNLTDTITVISTNKRIDLQSGSFECYQYQSKFKGFILNDYLAPGIGIIELEGGESWNGGSPFLRNRFELLAYKID